MAWAERNGHHLNPARVSAAEIGLEAAPGGGEHKILAGDDGRFYKLTKPGLLGAQAEDAGAYLQRWAWHNEIFGDDVRFEGFITLPGEHAPRAVISQPFYKGRDATLPELEDYLIERGFHKEGDRWVHPVRKLAVWDTITEGNAITTAEGVRVIDLQIEPARPEELRAVSERSGVGRDTTFSLGSDSPSGEKPKPRSKPITTDTSFSWLFGKNKGLYGELNSEGELSFVIEAGKDAPVRGTELWETMLQHFGDRVKRIRGAWTYGSNWTKVNELTARGVPLDEAVRETWTAGKAFELGFTRSRVIISDGEPGKYTRIHVLFEKP